MSTITIYTLEASTIAEGEVQPNEYVFGEPVVRTKCLGEANSIVSIVEADAVFGPDGDKTAEQVGIEIGYDKTRVRLIDCPDLRYDAMILTKCTAEDPKGGGVALKLDGELVELYRVGRWDEDSDEFLDVQFIAGDDW